MFLSLDVLCDTFPGPVLHGGAGFLQLLCLPVCGCEWDGGGGQVFLQGGVCGHGSTGLLGPGMLLVPIYSLLIRQSNRYTFLRVLTLNDYV